MHLAPLVPSAQVPDVVELIVVAVHGIAADLEPEPAVVQFIAREHGARVRPCLALAFEGVEQLHAHGTAVGRDTPRGHDSEIWAGILPAGSLLCGKDTVGKGGEANEGGDECVLHFLNRFFVRIWGKSIVRRCNVRVRSFNLDGMARFL